MNRANNCNCFVTDLTSPLWNLVSCRSIWRFEQRIGCQSHWQLLSRWYWLWSNRVETKDRRRIQKYGNERTPKRPSRHVWSHWYARSRASDSRAYCTNAQISVLGRTLCKIELYIKVYWLWMNELVAAYFVKYIWTEKFIGYEWMNQSKANKSYYYCNLPVLQFTMQQSLRFGK